MYDVYNHVEKLKLSNEKAKRYHLILFTFG